MVTTQQLLHDSQAVHFKISLTLHTMVDSKLQAWLLSELLFDVWLIAYLILF